MPLFIPRPGLWLRNGIKILVRLCPENKIKPKESTRGTHPKGDDRRGQRRPVEIVLILAFSLVFMLLSCSGCWDKTEIEDLAILTAWGVDREENGDILASAVIVKPFAVAGKTGEGSAPPERPFWLASSSGRNMLEAMCNFAAFSPRFIFCAHSRFVIFGEETARQGVEKILDFFERNREPRLTANLLVVKDMTAAEFLKSEFEMVPLPPEGGLGLIQNATRRLGTVVNVNLNDFLIALGSEGIEPVAGCFEVIPKRPVPLEGELERKEIIQSPVINGAAAFKDDRLVGWLNRTETRGLQWIRGKVENTPLLVENPMAPPALIGVEVIRANSAVTPSMVKGKPHVQIKIELEGNIEDAQGFFDPKTDPAVLKNIEKRMAAVIEKESEAVLHRCQQELNTDIFGFGATFHRSLPQTWDRLRGNWDTEFPRLEVSLDIKTHIRLSGLAIESIKKIK
ncbi:MAG: Ger(x)C family spore germination protein [Firmicutes bacterium]|nr:Ger(x)C family spore germination protein [Bacillota bacterium]